MKKVVEEEGKLQLFREIFMMQSDYRVSWLDDLLVVQQAHLKTFLKKMVEGFEVVMNKINTVVPRIEEEQDRVS